MSDHSFLFSMLIFLCAAVFCVPVSHRLGFGSVLGYLVGGLIIGPSGLGLVTDVEDIMHFSEFGVVLLLFLIGLELEPRRLWAMRVPILGMGGAQVGLCAALFFSLAIGLGQSWPSAVVIGIALSLSSTAIALQILGERKLLATNGGRGAFSILLFQDIAVIPVLALLPILAALSQSSGGGPGEAHTSSLSLLGAFRTLAILVLVTIAIKFILRRTLRLIASLHLREVFTALSLLLVIGMAALMQHLELSMGLGAFLAGVLLADSEYRHAVETDIDSFKGLLLGLFFIAVGMSVDVDSIAKAPLWILSAVTMVFLGKGIVHWFVAKLFRLRPEERPVFSLVLAQVGEFAFVIFGAALTLRIIPSDVGAILIATTAASMIVTPIAMKIFDQCFAHRYKSRVPEDAIDGVEENPVIIAGFGRVGQIVGRLLFANGISATVLDYEPDQIELLRRFGFKIYYGDATRIDLLESAGAAKAKILVAAIDDVEANTKLVTIAQQHFPHLRIIARCRNVGHYFDLKEKNVPVIEREAFDSSLRLGRAVLESLGWGAYQAYTTAQRFRESDLKLLDELYIDRKNDGARISRAKQARQDLLHLFTVEDAERREREGEWGLYDSPEGEVLKRRD